LIAIGLAPFINASIIMQLLGSVVPALEQLSEQGEA
jgi:preprotein translocase subunit SecY